jgi:hypothetical protein
VAKSGCKKCRFKQFFLFKTYASVISDSLIKKSNASSIYCNAFEDLNGKEKVTEKEGGGTMFVPYSLYSSRSHVNG